MARSPWIILLIVALLSGCTDNYYRTDADLQVGKLLKDREQTTLGYTPRTTIVSEPVAPPTKAAYAKIPFSPIPPDGPSAMEPVHYGLPYAPLGPDMLYDPDEPVPNGETLGERSILEKALRPGTFGPVPTGSAVPAFDIFKCIEYAAEHNRSYQSQMEDLYLAALQVTLARHLFEPRFFSSVGANYAGGQKDVNYRSALNVTGNAGVRQQLPYGGEIVAQGLVNFVNALNDNSEGGESATLALSGSIPLLKGAGMINLEPLIASERQLIYQVRQYEDFRRDFVVQIASLYFQLLVRQQNINSRLFNYQSALKLTERTEALYAAGRITFLEVQRALQQELSNENALNDGILAYQAALDNFKVFLGMPVEQDLDVVGVELVVDEPDLSQTDVTALALKYRLELKTAEDQVEDARRGVSNASNLLLPELRFTGSANISNPLGDPASHINSTTLDYQAGLNLDLPIDRVAERNAYRRALISFERAQRNYVEVRDAVVAGVRDRVRGVEQAQITIAIQLRAIELAQRRLEYSTELLIQGKASSRDVVDAQNSLLLAQDRYHQAKADYQVQILRLLRDTGTLRVNPTAGALGHALDMATNDRVQPLVDPRVNNADGG